MLRLFRFLKAKEWVFIVLSFGLIIFQVWLDLKLPDYMSKITTLVQTEGSKMIEVWEAGGLMLACALGSLLTAVVVSFIASRVSAVLSYRMRQGVYDKVESFSMEEIRNFSTSSLITRTTNDVSQVQMAMTLSCNFWSKHQLWQCGQFARLQTRAGNGRWQQQLRWGF